MPIPKKSNRGGTWHASDEDSRRELRRAFWLVARELNPAAFKELAAITVAAGIAKNWIEYCNERGPAIQAAMHRVEEPQSKADRARAARLGAYLRLRRNAAGVTFEKNLTAWAQRHHVLVDWIIELARGSRLAWAARWRKPLDVEPLPRMRERLRLTFRASDGATGLHTYELVPPRFDPKTDTDDSHQKRVETYREDVHTLHGEAGWVQAKVRRELERDLRWTVRAAMLGESWDVIAKSITPPSTVEAVRIAVRRVAADLKLPVGRRRPGRPKSRPTN